MQTKKMAKIFFGLFIFATIFAFSVNQGLAKTNKPHLPGRYLKQSKRHCHLLHLNWIKKRTKKHFWRNKLSCPCFWQLGSGKTGQDNLSDTTSNVVKFPPEKNTPLAVRDLWEWRRSGL